SPRRPMPSSSPSATVRPIGSRRRGSSTTSAASRPTTTTTRAPGAESPLRRIQGVKTAAELREGYLSYFESKGHKRHPSGSLVPPPEDTSTLFIVAGMQPLRPFFMGTREPPAPRLTTAQKVMRAGGKHNDLDDVGRTERHASFFEMLGNF